MMKNLHTGLGQRAYTTDTVLEMNSLSKMTGLEYVFCNETGTLYSYADSLAVPDNGTSVLSTIDGGDTRWVGIAGTYAYYAGAVLSNEIVINQIDPEIPGIQHQTFASAFAWIAANSPATLANPWTVRFTGTVVEDIVIPEFVFVNGKDKNTSKLMGDTTFIAPGTYESNMILNSTINNLVVDNSTLPPLPVMYTPMGVFQPYNPDTYEYGFGGVLGTDYGIQFQVNGVSYDTGLVIPASAPAATIQAAILAIDPVLFGSVTVSGSDPANSTVTMTLDGLPYLTSDYITFYSISGVFNPPTAIASVGDFEIQASILSALPTGGNIELTLDYGGTTFSSGVLTYAPDMQTVLTAGMNTILADIQTMFNIDNGIGQIKSGVLNYPGIGFVFYVFFEGFMGAVPANINIVPGTYTWETTPSFTYSIENCIINDTSMAGSNNIARINDSIIYGGDWDGHSNVEVYKSRITPVVAPIHFRTDTNLYHCNLECLPTNSLTLTESTIFLCSILSPYYLTLLVNARLRQSTFSFGSLTIPSGTNCKSFGSFYIDPVIVDAGGNFTSHGDILEQGHGGAGSWNSLVGATFDPAVKGVLNPATWETQDAIDELTDMIGAMSGDNDIIWNNSIHPTYEALYNTYNIASRTAPFKILLADSTAIYKIGGSTSGTPYANNNLITFESLGNPTTKPRLLFEGDWAGVYSTGTYACLNGVEVYNNITTATTSPFNIIGDSSKVGIIPPQMINSTITQSAGCIAPLFTYIVPSNTYMSMLLVNSSMDNGGASRPVFDIIEASPNTLKIDCYEYDSSSVAKDVFGSLTNDSTITFKIESNCSAVLNQFGMTANVSIVHLDNASKVLINDVYNINNIPVTDVESLVTKAAIQTYKWDMGFEPYFSNFYTNKKISHPSYPAGNHFIDLVNGSTFNLDPEAAIGNYLNLDYLSLRGRGTSNSRIAIQDSAKSDAFFNQLNNLALINFSTAGTGFVDSSIAGTHTSYLKNVLIQNSGAATKPLFYNSVDGVNVTLHLDNSTLQNDAGIAAYFIDNTGVATPGTVTIYLHNGSRVIGEVASPTTPLTIYYDNTSLYDVQTNPLASYQPLSDHNKDLNLQGGNIVLDEFYHLTKETYDELNPVFNDEFLGIQRGEWVATASSTGSTTFVELSTGWVKDTTGTTSGDFRGYDFGGYKCFVLSNTPMLKTRVQMSDITESKVEIGFKNAAGDKYIKFIYDSSVDAYWRFVADDGNGHVETGVYAANIGAVQTLLCKSSINIVGAPVFDIYINGLLQGSVDLTALDASFFNEYLEPFRLTTTLTTDSTAKDCAFDYIRIWQQ